MVNTLHFNKKSTKTTFIDDYIQTNFKIFMQSQENKDLLTNPDILNYEDGDSAFEKNITKYYNYQKDYFYLVSLNLEKFQKNASYSKPL